MPLELWTPGTTAVKEDEAHPRLSTVGETKTAQNQNKLLELLLKGKYTCETEFWDRTQLSATILVVSKNTITFYFPSVSVKN